MDWIKKNLIASFSLLFAILISAGTSVREHAELDTEVTAIKVEMKKREKNLSIQHDLEKRVSIIESNNENIETILKNQERSLDSFQKQSSEIKLQSTVIKGTVQSLNKTLDKVNNTLDKLNDTVNTLNYDIVEIKSDIKTLEEKE